MTTINNIIFVLTFLAALGCGLIAGTFFAFSTFIMGALGKIPSAEGIRAMQSINVAVINPAFMAVFMGTALLCIVVAVFSLVKWNDGGSPWLLAACVLYLVGSFGVTMIFNVPLNNALAAVDANSADGARIWASYLTDWTIWNTVRMLGSLAATAAFILGMFYRNTQQ
jgi:uncharacterized membrane protein